MPGSWRPRHRIHTRIASGAKYNFEAGQAFIGDNDLTEEAENGRIRLGIDGGSCNEPGSLVNGPGNLLISVPGVVPKESRLVA